MELKSRYMPLVWLVAIFVLHGITRMIAGLYVSDESALASLSFQEQKDILANDLLIVIVSKYLVPTLASAYVFIVGITVILDKHYPPRILPVPKFANSQSGSNASRLGLMLLLVSLFALGAWVVLIRRDVLVYLELFS